MKRKTLVMFHRRFYDSYEPGDQVRPCPSKGRLPDGVYTVTRFSLPCRYVNQGYIWLEGFDLAFETNDFVPADETEDERNSRYDQESDQEIAWQELYYGLEDGKFLKIRNEFWKAVAEQDLDAIAAKINPILDCAEMMLVADEVDVSF